MMMIRCAHCGSIFNPTSLYFADVPGEGDLCIVCHDTWAIKTDKGEKKKPEVVSVPSGQSPIDKEFKP